jgi:GLPGLI family protein
LNAQQRIVAECTITYSIAADSSSTDKDLVESLKESTKTIYIKGNNCRADLFSPAFKQSTFFDKTDGNAVVLREFGNNKFMTNLDNAAWKKQNSKFDGLTISNTNETKSILGYECKKATIQLQDSSYYELYFATAIAPSVKEFDYQFKDVPGFVLEYSVQDKTGKKIHYTATKINLSPVPASRFDIQSSNYRMLD